LLSRIRRQYQEEGRRLEDCIHQHGISQSTYHRWLRRAQASATPPGLTVEERARIVAMIEARREDEGASLLALVRAYGIGPSTFYAWRREQRLSSVALLAPPASSVGGERASVEPSPSLRAVEVVEPPSPVALPASPPLTVVSPDGYQITGLDVLTAAQLLKALR